jgi:protein involved in ribonucleotide reduction
MLNGLAQFVRQPGLQMVDVADNHEKTLNIKQRFIFIFYTRVRAAIPALFL